jgi:hypothetical protein
MKEIKPGTVLVANVSKVEFTVIKSDDAFGCTIQSLDGATNLVGWGYIKNNFTIKPSSIKEQIKSETSDKISELEKHLADLTLALQSSHEANERKDREIKRLRQKEIRSDRMIVKLEHDKVVFRSVLRKCIKVSGVAGGAKLVIKEEFGDEYLAALSETKQGKGEGNG